MDYLDVTADDTVLQVAAVTFDASVRDLLGPLTAGATVVLLPDGAIRDPYADARRRPRTLRHGAAVSGADDAADADDRRWDRDDPAGPARRTGQRRAAHVGARGRRSQARPGCTPRQPVRPDRVHDDLHLPRGVIHSGRRRTGGAPDPGHAGAGARSARRGAAARRARRAPPDRRRTDPRLRRPARHDGGLPGCPTRPAIPATACTPPATSPGYAPTARWSSTAGGTGSSRCGGVRVEPAEIEAALSSCTGVEAAAVARAPRRAGRLRGRIARRPTRRTGRAAARALGPVRRPGARPADHHPARQARPGRAPGARRGRPVAGRRPRPARTAAHPGLRTGPRQRPGRRPRRLLRPRRQLAARRRAGRGGPPRPER